MKAPAQRLGGSFLAGAQGRLLPVSVPMRYFGAAIAFHVLAWAALLAGAGQWPLWHGGPGWPLAALHLLTLGTLLCSAIGASLQLLPVATRQPVRWPGLAATLWWLYVPGVALLAMGMGLAEPRWMALGGSAVIGALLVFGVLLALNLAGAQGMPGVVLHGWGALAALALLLASAAALLALWLGRPWLEGTVARALHLVAAAFGVMGLLALGLSYILLPMFALAPVPAQRQQLAAGATALLALALGLAAAIAAPLPQLPQLPPLLRAAAAATGGLALAWHLLLMRRVLATGMRRDLGRSLRLMQLGWACAALALLLALAMAVAALHGAPVAAQGRALGVLLLVGWLLSFLLGVLQRVLPFLASLHAARGQRRPPTPSALTLDRALAWHARAHAAALVLLLAAAFADHPWLVATAAAFGLAGALAFALFFGVLLRRLAAPPAA
ncbi:MAG: hypothetical protein KIS83_13030 [Rubrivivax sp.]|nr:hypothetical protein [Rubrivivax sp.]